jgi:hypothetical protein
VLAQHFKDMHGVVLQYNAAEHTQGTTPRQWFVYRYVYTLLAYLVLALVARHASDDAYLPLLRLHLKTEEESQPNDEEDFLHGLSKVLAHVLGEDHLANAQGYVLSPTLPQTYRLTNTLSSLYSALPKTFRCPPGSHRPQLDRMALVVVSSRECDSVYGDPYKIATLYGEIVGIERTGRNTVGVHRITTFFRQLRQRSAAHGPHDPL